MRLNKYTAAQHASGFFINIFLIIVSVTCVFPLLWMFGSSLKTQSTIFSDMSVIPASMHWENFYLAWTKGGFGVYFLNSLFYTTIVVFGIVMVSSLAAYAFSRMNFPGKNLLFFMFLAAMMIPLPGSFVPLYVLVNNVRNVLLNAMAASTPFLLKVFPQSVVIGLTSFIEDQFYPRTAYILCMINVGLSFSIYMLKTFFDRMPKELEDAARIDGCSRLGIWRHVALPLAKPAIAVIIIYNALNVWNEYILANLILSSKNLMPLQRGLMVFQGEHITQYPLLMAGMTITVVPILIIYLVMQRFIIKGITAGAVVG
ncbi:sugar ABC transporter permease [Candidatus Velamenicoccus archaeovorus]|uniref:Sugar ABC transporter permease n=1 Tax=Velamenicoccus archaeovorus TaxID=1930593 RepID=A0A410P260_VELA1|nr:carbohydrate ABC transporter permease [Candidatus Velamenicoccus archaeovorus]QAT16269.1 sugar ABC transporter permease [Candidatus Velamenicoccus archaeovorus]